MRWSDVSDVMWLLFAANGPLRSSYFLLSHYFFSLFLFFSWKFVHFYTSPSYIIDYNVHYWGVVIKLAVFTHNGIKLYLLVVFL